MEGMRGRGTKGACPICATRFEQRKGIEDREGEGHEKLSVHE